MIKSLRKLAAPAALVVAIGATATAMEVMNDPIAELDAQTPSVVQTDPVDLSTAFRTASSAALPGVVYVEVVAAPKPVTRQIPEMYRGTPFEQFFGGPQMPQRPQRGSGSGFIISPDGYILTNNHVVDGASTVRVRLTDKREFDAKVVGRDPNTDVAVLKIDAENLPTVAIGDSDALRIGDWVLALGYPMSLGETVTAGIVSAKGKRIGIMGQNEGAEAPLENFIQTDAAINPGNSGGPLVNLRGEVIGMNTAIASPTGTYSGYGFAVPIALAKRVAEDLIAYGEVHRPRVGVQIRDVEPADKDVFGLTDMSGTVVAGEPTGPAKDAGIRLGDVIVAVDGQPVLDTGDLMATIALKQPGDEITLELVRYGDHKRVTLELGAFETGPVVAEEVAEVVEDAVSRLGFEASEVTRDIARELNLSDASGVVITKVNPSGPAPRVLTGMVIRQINGRNIETVADLREVAESLDKGATVSIIGRLPDGSMTIYNYRLP
ncbi:MAG TPA: trypsin-like peptidase domain-containing protein [Longimicrobiaceae bacterium]|nr:trypsin-like peptidase domain-containing protein [Longimicrobiaceae bacterium]